MRLPFLLISLIAGALVLSPATSLFAGVVMDETSIARGPGGETSAQNRTVYVQGDKQKVEKQGVDAITDLDKRVIYVIDRKQRAYAEVPLRSLGAAQPNDSPPETIRLSKTGQTRIIANNPCSEYRAIKGNKLERVTISACVSTSAPGAKEVAAFEHKMIERMDGTRFDRSSDHDQAGLMLEKQSVVSFRVPDLSNKAFKTTSLQSRTEVNQIQLKSLPADMFEPPKGFSKLPTQPNPAAPSNSTDASSHTIDIIAPALVPPSGGRPL